MAAAHAKLSMRQEVSYKINSASFIGYYRKERCILTRYLLMCSPGVGGRRCGSHYAI